MHDLVIYGASGMGRETAEMVRRINKRHRFWNFLGFVDDGGRKENLGGYEVLGGMKFIQDFDRSLDVVMAIADPATKHRIYDTLKPCPHVHFPHVIDDTAIISDRVNLGEGCIISAHCTLSVEISLGRCVFLNTGAHVGHDSSLGDFCSVMPSVDIAGGVTVGEDTLIGVGASILQGRRIGARSIVGMGAVVLANVPDGCTVLGNPARKF